MPIEIREIVIKTEIASKEAGSAALRENEILLLRKQLLEECRRIIAEKTKRNTYKR
ncbi:DUF5908 family protein [Flavobacterium sp.]|uniref:DUF5908 family protein n=1 Tax=Flavobacterium sp. TaxID=239 RepID=UPI0039E32FBF